MSSQKSTLTPVLRFAHQLVKERVVAGDYVIDATLGNGYDTLMLAQLVGDRGRVLSFDVQQQAFEKSRLLLEKHQALAPVLFICDTHANIKQHWEQQSQHSSLHQIPSIGQPSDLISTPSTLANSTPKVIMFNLGYLPGADKQYTTQVKSTLSALEQSLALLGKHGLVLVAVYPGHSEGALEDKAISAWVKQLDQRLFQVLRYEFVNQKNSPPYLLVIEKLVE